MSGFRGGFVVVDVGEFPGGAVLHEAADKGGMHGVAGAFRDDAALDAAAGEGEVADEVEHLVADELVVEAEGAVLDFAFADEDGAAVGGAADEAHVAEHGFVFAEAEGAGGGDEVGVGAGVEVAEEARGADGRGEVDTVVDLVAGAGVDADELGAVFAVFRDFDGLEDAQVLAAASLGFEAGAEEGFDVGEGGAVEDGNFKVVEFDDDVVDAVTDEGGEQVFRCGDEDALAHEGGGVGDAGDVAAVGGDFEVVEIGAAKDDARAGGGGNEAHADGCAAVQADALEVEWFLERVFGMGLRCQRGGRSPVPVPTAGPKCIETSLGYAHVWGDHCG